MEHLITSKPYITMLNSVHRQHTNYCVMPDNPAKIIKINANKSIYILSPSINHTVLHSISIHTAPLNIKSVKLSIILGNKNNEHAFVELDNIPSYPDPNPNPDESYINDVDNDICTCSSASQGESEYVSAIDISTEEESEEVISIYSQDFLIKSNALNINNTKILLLKSAYITTLFKKYNLSIKLEVDYVNLELNDLLVPKVLIHYYVGFDKSELARTNNEWGAERLLKRTNYDIVTADHLKLDLKEKACGLILVSSDLVLTGYIQLNKFIKLNFSDTEKSVINGRNLWVFDSDANMNAVKLNSYQPYGHFSIDDTACIKLNNIATFTVSYVYHDAIIYKNNIIALLSHPSNIALQQEIQLARGWIARECNFSPIAPLAHAREEHEREIEREQLARELELEIELEHAREGARDLESESEIEQPHSQARDQEGARDAGGPQLGAVRIENVPYEAEDFVWEQAERDERYEHNDISLNDKLNRALVIQKLRKNAVIKYINDTCVIGHEKINYGAYYFHCPWCYKVYTQHNLLTWLNTKKNCPHCIREIIELPELYYNIPPPLNIFVVVTSVTFFAYLIKKAFF